SRLTVRRNGDLSGPHYRIFTVDGGTTVVFSGLTVSNGVGDQSGGGIANWGTLTLNHTTVSDHAVLFGDGGGGSANRGTLTLNSSTVSGSSAAYVGGGIWNVGTLTLNNTTVSGNAVSDFAFGGGILNDGTLTLNNATISGNSVGIGGGG